MYFLQTFFCFFCFFVLLFLISLLLDSSFFNSNKLEKENKEIVSNDKILSLTDEEKNHLKSFERNSPWTNGELNLELNKFHLEKQSKEKLIEQISLLNNTDSLKDKSI